jgi:hypothetical protein
MKGRKRSGAPSDGAAPRQGRATRRLSREGDEALTALIRQNRLPEPERRQDRRGAAAAPALPSLPVAKASRSTSGKSRSSLPDL